jgi:hypothetical protein
MGQDDLALVAHFAFIFVENASEHGLRTEHAQQGRPGHHALYALGIPVDADGHSARVVERLLLEHVHLAQPVVVVGNAIGGPNHAGPRVAVIDEDQPIRLRDW